MSFKTVPLKGSKRKLLSNIESRIKEVNATEVFDGFSGTGIVSAHLRSQGYKVYSNDKMPSCNLFASVFLNGFNMRAVAKHIEHINWLAGNAGWITGNYSGERKRMIKGIKQIESRPLGFTKSNAAKLDVARDYADLIADPNDRNAVIFSIILAMDKVFNNTNDQKSCLKKWTAAALSDVVFEIPTLVQGPKGKVYKGDILKVRKKKYDVVYLDPPYTAGVLYDTCYHLNDSVVMWDQPALDIDYAIPRPERAAYRKRNQPAGAYYSKPRAVEDFTKLLRSFKYERLILSYSDAPRNILTFDELEEICRQEGTLTIDSIDHRICSQPKSLNKISNKLTEFLFIIDK
jgi:adenine-specific DNA methylase